MEFKILIIDGNAQQVYLNDELTHAEILLNYAQTNYEDDIFKRMTNKVPITVMCHFVQLIKNAILILDTTSKNHSKNGMIILPKTLTQLQTTHLYQILGTLNDFNHFNIISNSVYDDGILNANQTTINYSQLEETIKVIYEKHKKI